MKCRIEHVLAVGVAESRRTPGLLVLYQRIRGKVGPILRGDFVRVFPAPGDYRSTVLGPVEFWERYLQLEEHAHVSPVAQEVDGRTLVPGDGLVLGGEVDSGLARLPRVGG